MTRRTLERERTIAHLLTTAEIEQARAEHEKAKAAERRRRGPDRAKAHAIYGGGA